MKNEKLKILAAFLTFSFLAVLVAKSALAVEPTPTQVPVPTPTPKPKVDYALPWPGILPGHPLYPVKMLRDKIFDWFIKDPLKKAEYHLLMADKRLNAGLFLINKGKVNEGESTISKGEKYLEKGLLELQKAKASGKDITPVLGKFSLATLKHQEVLGELLEKVPEAAKTGIQNALEKSQKGIQRVQELQGIKLEEKLKGGATPPPPPPPVRRTQ